MEDSILYLEQFPSPAVVVSISVDKDNVRFFTDKLSTILRLQTQNGDKVPTGLTVLAPQIGMNIII
jgi:hypothetical protein